MDNIPETIKQRLKELPPVIREAILSSNLGEKFSSIANKHGLRMDQNGALQAETLLVMLGLESPDDYINNLEKEVGISRKEAESLATDVNTEILNNIRTEIRSIQEKEEIVKTEKEAVVTTPPPSSPPPAPASSVEKAGDFTIHTPPASHSPQYNDSVLKREEVLHDLENIEKLKPENANNFVEHLLSNPTSRPAEEEKKKTAPPPPPRTGPDPYREQI